MGNSRNDDVVACLVFWDALVYPISAAEGDVVRKCIFRNARVERIRWGNRKRTEHVLAGRRKVIGDWWCVMGRVRRTFAFVMRCGGGGGPLGERWRLVTP